MSYSKSIIALLSATMLAHTSTVAAVETAAAEENKDHHGHGEHDLEEITISANPLRQTLFESIQAASVLSGEDLNRKLSATIGETLDRLPGVSQTSFGPGASRPIIRGLGGDRVRTLINGIGTIDVSTTSADHAVAVDLSNAERVEVIRGPATLIYGNNASGGVISVYDGRIPTAMPEDGLDLNVRALYGTNAEERLFSGSTTFAAGNNIAFHVDGFYRKTGDIDIPGFARSLALRLDEPLDDDDEEEVFGTVENTDQENYGVTGGLSFIGERGFFGVSVSYLDNNYGLPGTVGHGHGHEEEEEHHDEEGEHEDEHDDEHEHEGEEEEELIRIGLNQVRVDVAGDYRFDSGFLSEMRLRFGYADYEQEEREGEEIAALFINEGYEGRLEFAHNKVGNFEGVFGFQLRNRDFFAGGEEEGFIEPNTQTQYGVFLLERGTFDRLTLEGGIRLEIQENSLDDNSLERDFTNFAVSGGYSYRLYDGVNLVGNVSYTERAPNPEELFSNGPHLATQLFEIGDPNLETEKSFNLEGGFNVSTDRVNGTVSVFYTNYDNYIAELFTGEIEDDLPVALFQNQDAEFFGFEIDTTIEAWRSGDQAIDVDFGVDYVEGHLTEIRADVPRIAPLSVRGGVSYYSKFFDVRVEGDWNAAQDQVFADDIELGGEAELIDFPTEDFFMLNASVTIHPWEDRNVALDLQVRNLLDEEVRFASSSIRDFLPAQGIDFRIGLRAGF